MFSETSTASTNKISSSFFPPKSAVSKTNQTHKLHKPTALCMEPNRKRIADVRAKCSWAGYARITDKLQFTIICSNQTKNKLVFIVILKVATWLTVQENHAIDSRVLRQVQTKVHWRHSWPSLHDFYGNSE